MTMVSLFIGLWWQASSNPILTHSFKWNNLVPRDLLPNFSNLIQSWLSTVLSTLEGIQITLPVFFSWGCSLQSLRSLIYYMPLVSLFMFVSCFRYPTKQIWQICILYIVFPSNASLKKMFWSSAAKSLMQTKLFSLFICCFWYPNKQIFLLYTIFSNEVWYLLQFQFISVISVFLGSEFRVILE